MKIDLNNQKCDVIVPLFGYFENSVLNESTLDTFLFNLKSSKYFITIYFVIEKNINDEIKNKLKALALNGGIYIIEIDSNSTYTDFIRNSYDIIVQESDSKFVLIVNPWIIMREDAIDKAIEETNKTLFVLTGTDYSYLTPEDFYENKIPYVDNKFFLINQDFNCMTKNIFTLIDWDYEYITHIGLWKDIERQLNFKNVPILMHKDIKTYNLLGKDVDKIYLLTDIQKDREHFYRKWSFNF